MWGNFRRRGPRRALGWLQIEPFYQVQGHPWQTVHAMCGNFERGPRTALGWLHMEPFFLVQGHPWQTLAH